LKYILFTNLGLPEGIVETVVTIIIPLYFIELKMPVEIITLVAGVGWIPWIFRFVWSSIIDYFIKYGRRLFVLLGGIIAAFCFYFLYFIPPLEQIFLYTLILFLGHIGVTLLLSAAAAWAIDICSPNERGKINGSMKAGEAISFGLTALLFSLLAQQLGFPFIFLITGSLLLCFLVLPFFSAEEKRVRERQKISHLLLKELKKKVTTLILVFGPFVSIAGGISIFVAPIFARTFLKLDVFQVGIVSASGILIGVPGSYIGGYFADKIGRIKTLTYVLVLSIFLYIVLVFIDTIWILVPYFILIFVGAFITAGLLALYMDVTNPQIAATQFSFFTGVANVGYIGGSIISGTLIALLGFDGVFLVMGGSLLPALLILYIIAINMKKSVSSTGT
jgi:PAT family beta-lactamase induction signal transducer AmpG